MAALKQLNNLPIYELISTPLKASIKAQHEVSLTIINYIKEIGLSGDKAQTLDFNIERPVISGDTVETRVIPVSAPLLGLVPLPSLLIETVNIEFTAAITELAESMEKKDNDGGVGDEPATPQTGDSDSAKPNSDIGIEKPRIEMFGKVISHSENMRKTNNSATYNIKIEAKKQEPTEGWSRILDLLATIGDPIQE